MSRSLQLTSAIHHYTLWRVSTIQCISLAIWLFLSKFKRGDTKEYFASIFLIHIYQSTTAFVDIPYPLLVLTGAAGGGKRALRDKLVNLPEKDFMKWFSFQTKIVWNSFISAWQPFTYNSITSGGRRGWSWLPFCIAGWDGSPHREGCILPNKPVLVALHIRIIFIMLTNHLQLVWSHVWPFGRFSEPSRCRSQDWGY